MQQVKSCKEMIRLDMTRYKGYKRSSTIFLPLDIQYIRALRKYQFAKNRIYRVFCRIRLERLMNRSQISIPVQTEIGPGFFIGHLGRVIINGDTKIGCNVNVSTGVTIGQINSGKKKGCPTIGNNVWIGSNAVIVGKIAIGDDVLIAPNSYVNFDVPPHSIVIGSPGVIHPRTSGVCDDYVTNRVDPKYYL